MKFCLECGKLFKPDSYIASWEDDFCTDCLKSIYKEWGWGNRTTQEEDEYDERLNDNG
jgi:hypothetical protein